MDMVPNCTGIIVAHIAPDVLMIEYEVDMRVFKFYFLIELIWPQMLIFSLLLLVCYISFFYVNVAKLLVPS